MSNSRNDLGYVTMRNADGKFHFTNGFGGWWELEHPASSEPFLMTYEQFSMNPEFSEETVRQSREDSQEYGIHGLQWHSLPVGDAK
jgi:hypothetical protein